MKYLGHGWETPKEPSGFPFALMRWLTKISFSDELTYELHVDLIPPAFNISFQILHSE
jgi:hypothetical protein